MPEIVLDRSLTIFIATALTLTASYAGSALAMNSNALLDDPNHRSSHDHAVSRAGGVAMLAASIAGLFILAAFLAGDAFSSPAFQFLALGALAAGLGLADDHLDLHALVKLAGQVLIAALFVLWVGPLETASLPVIGFADLGYAGALVTVFWIVAFMNAFNFMDGVNGIAGGAALVGLGIFAPVAALTGAGDAAAIALVIAAAAAGFLPANVLRGRLFMGDSGSHFLAFMIAGLAVYAANASDGAANPFLLPTIFLPFIVDVAFTLAHRIMRGENVLAAHRDHIYQLVLRRGASHATVAAIYAGVIAFSAAVSIFMLTLPPAWMWLAPASLTALLTVIALRIYAGAKSAGMIEQR